MSNQIEQIKAEIEREMLDQVTRAPYDVPEAAKKYADEQLLGHNRELAESGHTRHFKMGYVCFAGYDIEAAFADGMLAERERLMKEAVEAELWRHNGRTLKVNAVLPANSPIKLGDKVKLIILK